MFGKGNTISKRSLESMYIEGHWLERGVLRMTLRLGFMESVKGKKTLLVLMKNLKSLVILIFNLKNFICISEGILQLVLYERDSEGILQSEVEGRGRGAVFRTSLFIYFQFFVQLGKQFALFPSPFIIYF